MAINVIDFDTIETRDLCILIEILQDDGVTTFFIFSSDTIEFIGVYQFIQSKLPRYDFQYCRFSDSKKEFCLI